MTNDRHVYKKCHPLFLEFLPSLAWLTFMMAPLVMMYGYIDPAIRHTQVLGTCIFSLVIILADWAALAANRQPHGSASFMQSWPATFRALHLAAFVIFIVVPFYNVAMARDIPFLDRFFTTDLTALARKREEFNKLLEVPYLIKILFGQTLTVLAPLLLGVAILERKVLQAVFILAWGSFYAVVSLAKFPVILFAGTGLLLTAAQISFFYRRGWIATLVAVAAMMLVLAYGRIDALERWYTAASLSGAYDPVPATAFSFTMSPGDIERVEIRKDLVGTPADRPTSYGKTLDYLLYRTILTPVDVSSRWYEYYGLVFKGTRPLGELVAANRPSGWQHPANVIGQWAYASRFPADYLPSVHAYGSIDADAYSFGGLSGILVVAGLFGAIRLAIAKLHSGDALGRSLYICAIALMSLLPPSASLQAILVAQGLLTILIILALIRLATFLAPPVHLQTSPP